MRRARLDRGVGRRAISEALRDERPVGAHQPGCDRLLRAGAAGKQAPLDEQDVGAFAHGELGVEVRLRCAEGGLSAITT